MYKFVQVKTSAIYPFINGYYESLLAPMDDMWEDGILPNSTYYRIDEDETVGFFAVDDENVMTQFYVVDLKHEDVFLDVIKYFHIKKAYVSSYDPVFKAVSDKFKNAATVNTLLYKQSSEPVITIDMDVEVQTATLDELDLITAYYEMNDLGGPWLENYLRRVINSEGVLIFKSENMLVGTGEFRVSKSSPEYANVGMTVDVKCRNKGLGRYILAYMRDHCNQLGYDTICSTTTDNHASKRCIGACGYEPYHTIYDVWL